MDGTGWGALAAGAVATAIAAANLAGARRWSARTRALVARLEAARRAPPARRFDPRELEGLPEPAARYFRAALSPGQAAIAAASLAHAGEFNLSETGQRWVAFASRQRVLAARPGFVWDGCVRAFPGVPVRVHDAYVAGEGLLEPAWWGLVPLGGLRGTPEVAKGELMRWLAEAPWYPTALLPGAGVRWDAVDGRSARATLADGELSVTLLFAFRDDGLVDAVCAEARPRTVGGRIVPTAWEGRWTDYRERDGMRVPFAGEAAWLAREGRLPYWRGAIAALSYEFAD